MQKTLIPKEYLHEIAERIRAFSPLSESIGNEIYSTVRLIIDQFINEELTEVIQHPYGFWVVHLGKLDDMSALRLHLWPPIERLRQTPDWPLHNHPWDIKSFVLVGRLKHEVRRLADGNDFRIYEIEYETSKSSLVRTNNFCSVEVVFDQEIKEGMVYTLNSTQFHAADEINGEFAASLLITERPTFRPPCVLGAINGDAKYYFPRNRIDSILVEKYLSGFRSILQCI